MFISDNHNQRIQIYTSDAVFIKAFGSRGANPGQFAYPHALAFDLDGNLIVLTNLIKDSKYLMPIANSSPCLECW